MITLLLAATLVAAPQTADNATALRTFCKGDAVLVEKTSKAGSGNTAISFSNSKMRVARLPSGQVMRVHTENGDDQLVVEENGKFRRLVSGRTKIHSLYPSPDGKKVAVVVVHETSATLTNVQNAGLYLFDTQTWVGEQIVKVFGFSGAAWSPDSALFAYGDYAKARFFDVAQNSLAESCGIDSVTTEDGRERIQDLGWLGPKVLRLTYQSPLGKHDYQVTLP